MEDTSPAPTSYRPYDEFVAAEGARVLSYRW